MFVGDAVFVQLPGDQKSSRNAELFLLGVPRDFDDLHPIAQCGENRILEICRGDKHQIREIERYAEVMIAERVVLFRIEHLQQCRGRIAAEIGADLVHLIHHEHRIIRSGLLESLDDAAG